MMGAVVGVLTVVLNLVPHHSQRYDTVGDWQWEAQRLEIRVSREIGATHPEYVSLVFVHELVEALLCRHDGISAAQVDAFDKSYSKAGEPGDDPAAPYYREHRVAERVERQMAAAMGVKWADYQAALERISGGA